MKAFVPSLFSLLALWLGACTNTEIEYRDLPPPKMNAFLVGYKALGEPNQYVVRLAFEGMGNRQLAIIRLDLTEQRIHPPPPAFIRKRDSDDPIKHAITVFETDQGEASTWDEKVKPGHEYEYWIADKVQGFRWGPARVRIPYDMEIVSRDYSFTNGSPFYERLFLRAGKTELLATLPQLIGKQLLAQADSELLIQTWPPSPQGAIAPCGGPLLLVANTASGSLKIRADTNPCTVADAQGNTTTYRAAALFIWIREESDFQVEWVDEAETQLPFGYRCVTVGSRLLYKDGNCARARETYEYLKKMQESGLLEDPF